MAHVMSVCEKILDVSMLARVVKSAGVMEIFQYKRGGMNPQYLHLKTYRALHCTQKFHQASRHNLPENFTYVTYICRQLT
jgi:hypothetical protein